MSPLVEADAIISVPIPYPLRFLIQAREVIEPIWLLISYVAVSFEFFYYFLDTFKSHSLTTLSIDPAAKYREEGEKAQADRDGALSFTLLAKLYSASLFSVF